LSPRSARADAAGPGVRARLSEAIAEKENLETAMAESVADNERLRNQLTAKARQLTQAKQYRKHVAADKRDAQSQVSSLQAELEDSTEAAAEMASEYEEMQMELLFEQSRAERRTRPIAMRKHCNRSTCFTTDDTTMHCVR
jgi:chromosome segregation ATPase